jgi:arylsulfatase A-like enzyme/Flp pilus assembly protein TadD
MIPIDWKNPRARVAGAVIAGALLLALAAGLWLQFAPRRGNGTSVVLITLDAARADRLGTFGGAVRTPQLDALGRDGVRFEQAYTAAPLCLPAHASILTGRWPRNHGLRTDAQDLEPGGGATAAEVFKRAGYRTAAVVGSTTLDRSHGLARGFEEYLDDLNEPGKRPGRGEREGAEQVVDRALGWLSAAGSQPVFLWVHLSDAKAPHLPPDDLAREYAGRPYDGEIAALDRAVGRLRAKVGEARPQAIVAVISDHGDALGDHGEEGFGYFLYSATTRVPLLMALPSGLPHGVKVPVPVRSIDLLPTLLDLCGLRGPRMDGRTLRPLIEGRSQKGPGPAVIENLEMRRGFGLAPLFALRDGAHLYVRAPRPELYDVAKDTAEQEDIAAREPQVTRRLEDDLPPPESALDKGAAADPKDFLDLLRRYRAGQAMEAGGNCAQAALVYRSILSEAPDFALARVSESEALTRCERWDEAALALEELIKRREATDGTYLNLALVYHRSRRPEQALEWLRKGVTAFPRSAALRHRTGRVLLQLKRPEEAVKELEEALALEPRFLDARLALGLAEEARGRRDPARAALQEAQQLSPSSSEAKEAAEALGRLAAGTPR